MRNNGTLTHEHFEELAALAALGEASPEELRELQIHAVGCESCRAHYLDFEQILNEGLPVLDTGEELKVRRLRLFLCGDSYKARFAARAAQYDIAVPILKPTFRIPAGYAAGLGVASLVLFLTVGIFSYRVHESHLRDVAANARLQQELAQLQRRVDELRSAANKLAYPSESTRAEEQFQNLQIRTKALENELKNTLGELEKTRTELLAAQSSERSDSERLRESELALARATD